MADGLTRLIRAIFPKATPTEIAEAAERLGSVVESGASWVGDTAEHAVRNVGDVLRGEGAARRAPRLSREEENRLWAKVSAALAPRVQAIEDRALALREDPNAPEPVLALARDVDWLVEELRAAWNREVALRAERGDAAAAGSR